MRFDFSCDHKLTDEEKKAVEDLVNKWIDEGLPVTKKELIEKYDYDKYEEQRKMKL